MFGKKAFPIVAETTLYFGLLFYNRWLMLPRVGIIADALHLSSELLVVLTTVCLVVCAAVIVFPLINYALKIIRKALEKSLLIGHLLYGLITAVVTVMLVQIMIGADILSMGIVKFCWGILTVYVVVMVLYCLTGNMKLALLFGTAAFMVVSTVNVYVYNFRGRLFEPIDVFSFETALNVADNYSLWPIPSAIVSGWAVWATFIYTFFVCSKEHPFIPVKIRVALSLCCFAGLTAVACYTYNLSTYHWNRDGAILYGYVLDFTSKLKEAHIPKPDGYSEARIEEATETYTLHPASSNTPHIIVIMDEAFSDLSVHGDIRTDIEVTPFLSSLKDNVTSGYSLVSVYGGNTANSEYEFLTGNTMAWLSPNAVPYQQHIRSSAYSMVSYLKTYYNYHCIAMHPYLSSGWNRPNAYRYFGFDDCLFVEDFPQENTIRNFVSDQEMFEKIVSVYESHKEKPLFIFGVSMQNHGDYYYSGSDFTQSVSLVGYENNYPAVEQYLSLLHETDHAVEYLISYFSETEEDVVIVFFGDHQPKIEDAFYEELGSGNSDDLDIRQNRYKVPFLVWTNFDSKEQTIECTSLNYLSSYVYECAGIELPPYNQFLSDMEEVIPSINSYGFYSKECKHFLAFDQASETERKWLQAYEILQYNNLFGGKHRNSRLFVTVE